MVTIPPEVVLILASSTVFVKASSLVNRDFGAIVRERERAGGQTTLQSRKKSGGKYAVGELQRN